MKKRILIGLILFLLVGLAVAISIQLIPQESKADTKVTASTSEEIESEKETPDKSNEKETVDHSGEIEEEVTNSSEATEEGEKSTLQGNGEQNIGETFQNSNESGNDQSINIQPSYMTFPFKDDNKGIEVQSIEKYSGYFIEDGTDEEVSDTAVIMVKNTSEQIIEYGNLTLSEGETMLEFHFSLLPPGETALVMEANRKTFNDSGELEYQQCDIAFIDSLDMESDKIQTEATENGGIRVINISEEDIASVRIFYKNKLDENTYLGGIAYTVEIQNLTAGEDRVIYPSHYSADYGEIMMIRIY